MIDCFWVVMSVVTEVALTGTGLWVGEEHMYDHVYPGEHISEPDGTTGSQKQAAYTDKC